jgi:hypothetical protein
MTATLPVPTRVLALLGVLVLAALAFLVVRPLLSSDDGGTSPATVSITKTTTATPKATTPATKPKIVLVDGLPNRVASKLRLSKVAVVSVYSGTASVDRAAVGEAKSGARAAGAAFARLNVLDENQAREVQSFAGTVDTPAVLIVRRPGKIVTRFEGLVDTAVVEQAAHNAGARGR